MEHSKQNLTDSQPHHHWEICEPNLSRSDKSVIHITLQAQYLPQHNNSSPTQHRHYRHFYTIAHIAKITPYIASLTVHIPYTLALVRRTSISSLEILPKLIHKSITSQKLFVELYISWADGFQKFCPIYQGAISHTV